MYANVGRLDCYGVEIDPATRGAIAKGNAAYRGEAYVVNGKGDAVVSKWSPNTATVEYANVTGEGAILVYNMNWDPNWSANGDPAWENAHAVAIPVKPGSGRVVFSYYPRIMNKSLLIFAFTVFGAFFAPRILVRAWNARKARRGAAPPVRTSNESSDEGESRAA